MSSLRAGFRGFDVAGAVSRVVVWVYAYYAFEWLFFATKPSIVTSSPWSVRLLMLLVPPLVVLAVLIPVQALAASAARWRRARILSVLLPATVATLLGVIAVENFSRTVYGRGIADLEGWSRILAATVVVLGWVAVMRYQYRQSTETVGRVAVAIVLIVVSLGALTVVLLEVPPKAALETAGRDPRAPRSNVLLIGIDGVVAERMSLYGAKRNTTPFLDTGQYSGTMLLSCGRRDGGRSPPTAPPPRRSGPGN